MESYYKYWAKASKNSENDSETLHFHLLPYHNIDVCECGLAILPHHPLPRILANRVGYSVEFWKNLLTLGLLFHDIGKLLPAFQRLIPNESKPVFLQQDRTGKYERHTYGSKIFIGRIHASENGHLLKGVMGSCFNQKIEPIFIAAIAGHHGKPVSSYDKNSMNRPDECFLGNDKDILIADYQAYTRDILEIYPMSFDESYTLSEENLNTLKKYSWIINGFVSLCDWIGSSDAFRREQNIIPLAEYRKIAKASACKIVAELSPYPKKVSRHTNIQSLFPYLVSPRPMQLSCETVPVSAEPSLWIIEDSTGSGKTEAALFLAERIAAAHGNKGVFFGLPTAATANGIYSRLIQVCPSFFEEGESPSTILAHATAASFLKGMLTEKSDESAIADEDDGVPANSEFFNWFNDNNKKALLADFGVGTIDQALLSVLRVKYVNLRLLGLSGKVLLLDEIHSFDEYMNCLIQHLLKICRDLEISVILMSATLSESVKSGFLKAYGAENITAEDKYPLITTVSGNSVSHIPVDSLPELRKTTAINLIHNEQDIIRLLRDTAQSGHCACWIRNTVTDAVDAYKMLQENLPEGCELILFHSRFTRADRANIENRILDMFGAESSSSQRSGKILIATQVVEQSLDVDFDELVTDLVPIDLLIQREGRYRRHRRLANGDRSKDATDERGKREISVYSPEFTETPEPTWYEKTFPKAAYVYPKFDVNWLTAKAITENPEWHLPADSRKLISAVYGEEEREFARQFFEDAICELEGKDYMQSSAANQSTIPFQSGYGIYDTDDWVDERRISTRLGEKSNIWELCLVGADGRLSPLGGGQNNAWNDCKISIGESMLTSPAGASEAACKNFRTNDNMDARLRKRLNPLPAFPLEGLSNHYRLEVSAHDKIKVMIYSPRFGLIEENIFGHLAS